MSSYIFETYDDTCRIVARLAILPSVFRIAAVADQASLISKGHVQFFAQLYSFEIGLNGTSALFNNKSIVPLYCRRREFLLRLL